MGWPCKIKCPRHSPCIVMRVEVDDADILLAVDVGNRCHVGIFERMVPSYYHRNRARLRDLFDHRAHGRIDRSALILSMGASP